MEDQHQFASENERSTDLEGEKIFVEERGYGVGGLNRDHRFT